MFTINWKRIMEQNATLTWVYFWGALTLLFAWITEGSKSTWTFITVIVTFLLLVVGASYGLFKSLKRKRIRHTLSEYLGEGQNLSMLISTNLANQEQMNQWVSKVEHYIAHNVGKDDETLFLGTEGLSSHWSKTEVNYVMLAFLELKLQRLHELVERLSS